MGGSKGKSKGANVTSHIMGPSNFQKHPTRPLRLTSRGFDLRTPKSSTCGTAAPRSSRRRLPSLASRFFWLFLSCRFFVYIYISCFCLVFGLVDFFARERSVFFCPGRKSWELKTRSHVQKWDLGVRWTTFARRTGILLVYIYIYIYIYLYMHP